MATGPLTFRKPEKTWMLLSGIAALCLHGALWFVAQSVFGGDSDAMSETQIKMVLAVSWIVCALVLWKIGMPASRLHAVLSVLTCALFVTGLGSVAALIKLIFIDRAEPTHELLSSFGLLSGLMLLAHLALAAPTAILLQGLALSRKGN